MFKNSLKLNLTISSLFANFKTLQKDKDWTFPLMAFFLHKKNQSLKRINLLSVSN